MPTVTLYAHRLHHVEATGIHHYVDGLVSSIRLLEGRGINYRIAASRQWGSSRRDAMEVLHPWPPRKALHLSWAATNRPRIDRAVGYPDLVHVLYPSSPVPCRAPVIYTVHDLMPLRSPEWHSRVDRWLFGRAADDLSKRAALVIANSRRTADEVVGTLGVASERIRVIPLGVDDAFFAERDPVTLHRTCAMHGVSPGEFFIVLGAVSSRKNLAPVIKALACTTFGDSDPKLLVVGPFGRGADQFQAMARDLGLRDRVKFTGWLPASDVRDLLGAAAGLLHPSLDEGFGMTPLEAMACGTPAVASNVGALPEVVGDSALLLDPFDPDAWRDAMTRLINDRSFGEELRGRGREHAREFRWSRVAEMHADVHREVLG
jgi:glycosyltransferase involved in cell wall biosynthesis